MEQVATWDDTVVVKLFEYTSKSSAAWTRRYSLYLLYWYKSRHCCSEAVRGYLKELRCLDAAVLTLLALLVQKYTY
jgi:hypothetical protein